MVTSSFHMPRTKHIFNKCFELAGQTRAEAFSLSFEEASDEGTMPPEVLHIRAEKEHRALKVSPCSHRPSMMRMIFFSKGRPGEDLVLLTWAQHLFHWVQGLDHGHSVTTWHIKGEFPVG